jgi:hypothetical protein
MRKGRQRSPPGPPTAPSALLNASSRSCIRCGTYHELDSTSRKNHAIGVLKLKCSSCSAEGSQDLSFHPTIIARESFSAARFLIVTPGLVIFSPSPLPHFPALAALKTRKLEGRIATGESGIHEHLYANSSQQAHRVQLLQRAWGETDQDNTFQ